MKTPLLPIVLLGIISIAPAQNTSAPAVTPPAIVRQPLLTALLSPSKSVARVEIKQVTLAPSQRTGLHLHPCPVVGVITTGRVAIQVEGQPLQHLGPGEAFFEPANTRMLHFDNERSDSPATFTAFYLFGENEHEIIRPLSE